MKISSNEEENMSIEEYVASVQPYTKDDPAYVTPIKLCFWKLGQRVKMLGLPFKANDKCFLAAIKRANVPDGDLYKELYSQMLRGYDLSKLHPDALQLTAKAVDEFIKCWGPIRVPEWCTIGKYHRLYLAVHIIGIRGRTFPFAQNAVGNAFGMSSNTVRCFIDVAMRHTEGCLVCVRGGTSRNPKLLKESRKGERLGKPSYYRLRREDPFGNLNRIATKGDKIRFIDALKNDPNMAWLFY